MKVLGDITLCENVTPEAIIPKNKLKYLLGGCEGGGGDPGGGCDDGTIYCTVKAKEDDYQFTGKCAMTSVEACKESCEGSYSSWATCDCG